MAKTTFKIIDGYLHQRQADQWVPLSPPYSTSALAWLKKRGAAVNNTPEDK